MLIISKDKDYYDGVAGTMGIDKTIVFERKYNDITNTKEIPKAFKREKVGFGSGKMVQYFSYRSISHRYINANHFIIGFCGKLYLGFKMYYYKDNQDMNYDKKSIDITYDINEFKKHFKPFWSFAEFDDFVNNIKNYDAIDIHRILNAPIFVFEMKKGPDSFIINPILKEYEFYKVFDSFTAFQEIQMFISGVLGIDENPIVEVSDKDKIISRGFDYKWSFRKPPTKK